VADHERITGKNTLIVLPTYNEMENLPRIVPAALDALPDARLLVVDDLSPDGTGDLADRMAAEEPRMSVMHRDGPRGLGPAYIAGFRWALERPDIHYIFEMDADFSHQPRHLPEFLAAARDADLVLGCRYMEGGGIEGWGPHRQLISRGGNIYARAILGLKLKDMTGGFKCFRREVLEALDLDNIGTQGYGFQIELTWRAHKAGFRIKEVPIVFIDRVVGQSKMNMGIMHEAMLAVWKLRLGR